MSDLRNDFFVYLFLFFILSSISMAGMTFFDELSISSYVIGELLLYCGVTLSGLGAILSLYSSMCSLYQMAQILWEPKN